MECASLLPRSSHTCVHKLNRARYTLCSGQYVVICDNSRLPTHVRTLLLRGVQAQARRSTP
eukprot:7284134-Prymnesium_polylepis.2